MRLISWNVNGRYGRALPEQIAAVKARQPDVVALQEVRLESLDQWRAGLVDAGLAHVLDTSALLAEAGPAGRDYKRRYFNLVAARCEMEPLSRLGIAFPERYVAALVRIGDRQLEIHNAHAPPGSTRGTIKIEMFEALYERLAHPSDRPRILCGDLNTPRSEGTDGTVEFWGDKHPAHKGRWNAAERSIVLGLAEHDLPDVFRSLNGYGAQDASWEMRRGGELRGRRYDHVFASRSLAAQCCWYLHELRQTRLSDHSPIEAVFAPKN